jgi:hypothetical protein
MREAASEPPRFLTAPLEIIGEIVAAAEPSLDRELVDGIAADVAGRRPQQRKLAQALYEAPDLLTSGRPEGPIRIQALIQRLLEHGAEHVVLPRCAVCSEVKPLVCATPNGLRCCSSCGARNSIPVVTCARCGRERAGAVRARFGQRLCAPCSRHQALIEYRPDLVEHLAKLGTGLAEQALVAAVDQALPHAHQRRVVCWELDENPTRLATNAAEGSLRLITLAQVLIAAGARGVAAPACLFCGRSDRQVRSKREGKRCCHSCYDKEKQAPCSRCGELRVLAARTHTGEPLCDGCYRRDPINHEVCTGCGKRSWIEHRDDGDRLCASCWAGAVATCSMCGKTKPCSFAGTPAARCAACTSRLHNTGTCSKCEEVKIVHARIGTGELLCARCGRIPRLCTGCSMPKVISAVLPDGSFCQRCYRQHPAALRPCTSCGTIELLHHFGLCVRCAARSRLHDWASSKDGSIPEFVSPVVRLLGDTDPVRLMAWMDRSSAAPILRTLLEAGQLVSHEVLDQHLPSRSVQFLRAVLVNGGLLEPRDEHLAVLERWLPGELARIHDDAERRVVASFARWHHLNKLRAQSRRQHLSYSEHFYVRKQLRATIDLVIWLRQQDLALGTCTQADLDRYLTTGAGNRYLCKKFVDWTTRRGHTQALEIPTVDHQSAGVKTIPDDERWALLRQLLHDDQLDPVSRFSGLLVLLFAQPASRIVRLTTDQIITTKGKVQILIGRKPLDLPPPLNDLAQQLLARRRGHALLGHTDENRFSMRLSR